MDLSYTYVKCNCKLAMTGRKQKSAAVVKSMYIDSITEWNSVHHRTPMLISEDQISMLACGPKASSNADFLELFRDFVRVMLNAKSEELDGMLSRWEVLVRQ